MLANYRLKKKQKTLLDQRLLTKYLTKLPGLPSRLGSLRGSRVPAHLKKHKQSHVYTRPNRLQSCTSLVCRVQSVDALSSLTDRFWRTASLNPAHWSHGNVASVAARRTIGPLITRAGNLESSTSLHNISTRASIFSTPAGNPGRTRLHTAQGHRPRSSRGHCLLGHRNSEILAALSTGYN